jgi:hypothetical protein
MPDLRLLLPALLCAVPLAAQNPSRHTLQGSDVVLYNLAGTVQIGPVTGDAVTVEVARGGADLAKVRVAEGPLEGRSTLRVVYPGDRVTYPPMGSGSTELRVRDDGTFGGHDHEHDHDDDDDDGGRRVTISNRGGLEAWADLKIGVPAGRKVAVHLAVGKISATNVDGRVKLETANAPVTVNGAKGELEVEVGSGDVDLSATQGDLEGHHRIGRRQAQQVKRAFALDRDGIGGGLCYGCGRKRARDSYRVGRDPRDQRQGASGWARNRERSGDGRVAGTG